MNRARTHNRAKPASPDRGSSSWTPPPIGQVRERERQRKFVEHFMAMGNATQAAIRAGYSRKSARRIATRLLSTNVHIHKAITARVAKLEARGIAAAVERDIILSMIARDPRLDISDRIRAIAELNKSTGRHSMKHLPEGKLTLEQVLAQSREVAAS